MNDLQLEAADAIEPADGLAPTAAASDEPAGVPHVGEIPPAALAYCLAAALERNPGDLLYIARSENRAEEIGRALRVFATAAETLVLPGWDCLPYDRASPSRDIMGRRMSALARLDEPSSVPRILITAPEGAVQRLPPLAAVIGATLTLRVGERLDRAALEAFAARTGYVHDERVDEPGEILIQGEVVDVFPPDLAEPVRLKLDEESGIVEIDRFDPLSQRSTGQVESIRLCASSELVGDDVVREAGCEHGLPRRYGALRTVFDLPVAARIICEDAVAHRVDALIEQAEDAWRTQRDFAEANATPPQPATALYLGQGDLASALDRAATLTVDCSGVAPGARFADARSPGRAFASAVKDALAGDGRAVLTGMRHELRALARALERTLEQRPSVAKDWPAALRGSGLLALEADLAAGFADAGAGLLLIAASDVFGGRVAARSPKGAALLAEPELRPGDVVIHEDHGVGVLRALERITVDAHERDVLRLEYHGGATVLAPIDDIGRIWRYGAEEDAVSLDRLKGDGWAKRRVAVSATIDSDARALVEQARQRQRAKTAPIIPPKAPFARFAARFSYPETPDQRDAVSAILNDLASGRPMERLICGDVGFGKTEVALRAAAAVALAGRQVAIAAPTTVLARQHAQTFARRFAGTGVKIAQLSRLVDGDEAAAARAGLASGEIGVVIGTHALAGEQVRFKNLALMILDEEQKFGAGMKATLRGKATHILSMTATPIPRTLQGAMVGVQDVSVIATPPARRRPIRTFLAPFDAATMRMALMREKRRGGQSFVVAPRISDLEGLKRTLSDVVPELSVSLAHGELAAETVDEAMVRFADGKGDVLLATNIIESGLDVPRANTMLVWRADRFGLAQLHQLRGRVGRGRSQGVAYLFTDPEEELPDATRARLATLEAFDRLGSGLAISARDLDLRGGGELVGEEQAGHMKLIGLSLYHRLMERAVRAATGEQEGPDWSPDVQLDEPGALTEGYIPDAVTRINLYARLARLTSADEIDAFQEELDDRFGPLPPEAAALIDAARLQALARLAGVRRVVVGPSGAAMDLDPTATNRAQALAEARERGLSYKPGRLILAAPAGEGRLPAIEAALHALEESAHGASR